jgi:amino acid transporter
MVASSFPQTAPYAENAKYVLPAALVLLVFIVASNYVGLHVAKWVDNLGGAGVYLIWVILVIAAVVFVFRYGSATHFQILPNWHWSKLNFWSQLAFGMTGLELSPILSGEIRDPKRSIFRATWISAGLVVLFYVAGTAAILAFLSPGNVSPVIGLTQAGTQAAARLGWTWAPVAIAACILLSVGGQLGTYIGASARLPFVLGIGNLLPPAFGKLHPRHGTPYLSILVLGIGSGVLLVISQLGETFRAAYQITVDMSVITLFIPFLYIFGAAWKFKQRFAALAGLSVSAIAIAFSFIPTEDVQSPWLFEAKLLGGCALLYVIALGFYRRYRSVAP